MTRNVASWCAQRTLLWPAVRNLAAVRVLLGVAQVGDDLFLQAGVDEVFHALSRIVNVIDRQAEMLDEICFP